MRTLRLISMSLLLSALACDAPAPDGPVQPGKGGSTVANRGGAAGGVGVGGSSSRNNGGAGASGVAGSSGTVGAGGSSSATEVTGGSTAVTGVGGATGGKAGASGAAGSSGDADAGAKGGTAGTAGATGKGGAGGTAGSSGPNCTKCHGDTATNSPAPPSDTEGNADTASPGVGAHAKHLSAASWHRQGKCVDCHTPPTTGAHSNGQVDFTWGTPSNADNAKPSFNTTNLTCTGAYCHGSTLAGASTSKTAPVWNQVDETWNDCGTACHATPPPASTGHPQSSACETCHSKVIASFKATSPSTTWKDASLHINGTVDVDDLTCTSCHGSGTNPAPPKDPQGNTATTAAGVGAHAQHLGSAIWHRQGQCADCHARPTSMSHSNNTVDFKWGAPSNASGATPAFDATALSCSGTYCHGAKMTDKSTSVGHVPVWNKVDGTHDACGKSCHATPPAGGSHTASSTACQSCHADVIASFNGANSTWKNASLHINGKVEATQSCSSCHGNPPTTGTHRRREHNVACNNCHPNSSGATHRNGRTDVTCGSGNAGCHEGDD